MFFVKSYGLGNDFIMIFDSLNGINIKLLADRKFGIGADQIIHSIPYEDGYAVKFWNQDGSEASLCGNGIRCLAKYLNKKWNKFYTKSGLIRTVNLDSDVAFCLPLIPKIEKFNYKHSAYDINVGNEHIVIFGDSEPNWKIVTYELKNYLNDKNIMWIWKSDSWNIRSWERGVGETLACGSGTIAAACAVWEKYSSNENLVFKTKIGELCVLKKNKIWQIGPASIVAKGEFVFTC